MVKYFSVDWLAQSHHHSPADPEDARATTATAGATGRPHVPCMVQPAPPTFGKSCLQLKPSKTPERKETRSCPSSPESKSGEDSSGDESKAGPPGDKVERDTQRRVRTKFSTEQLSKLESIFHKHKYLDVVRRVKTAQKLELTETQVRTWFQNRRMKLKREMQDNVVSPPIPPESFQRLMPMPMPVPVPVPFGGMAGQPAPYPPPHFDGAFYYPLQQLAPPPQMPPPQMPPPHLMALHPHPFYSRTAA